MVPALIKLRVLWGRIDHKLEKNYKLCCVHKETKMLLRWKIAYLVLLRNTSWGAGIFQDPGDKEVARYRVLWAQGTACQGPRGRAEWGVSGTERPCGWRWWVRKGRETSGAEQWREICSYKKELCPDSAGMERIVFFFQWVASILVVLNWWGPRISLGALILFSSFCS